MAALTTDHLCMWFGTNAGVPSGWTKYATANDCCFQGGGTVSLTPAGADTHTHTESTGGSSTHVAGETTHTHNVSSDSWSGGAAKGTSATSPLVLRVKHQTSPAAGHFHPSAASSNGSGAAYADAGLGTISTENHLPPTTTCILIHPTTGTKDLPDDASVFLDSGTLPSGYNWHDGVLFDAGDGNHTAIDLTDEYVKGVADASTTNGGGAAGQATHTHTTPGHVHTGLAHTHDSFTPVVGETVGTTTGLGQGLVDNHHTIQLDAPAVTPGDTTACTPTEPSSDATTVEPPYVKLMAAQNTSGADNNATGMICLYKGASAGSVTDWVLCDGSGGTQDTAGKFVKVTNTSAHIGNTGGTSEHQHITEFSHTHTFPTHTHTAAAVSEATFGGVPPFGGGTAYGTSHVFADHAWTVIANGPTANATTVNTTLSSHLPKNITLAFLKYSPSTGVKIVSLGGVYQTTKIVLVG